MVARVLVAGDSHGDAGYIRRLFGVAKNNNCDVLYIVGDFGFGSHKDDVKYLDACEAMASEELPLYWLDGNHEDHSALREGYILPHFSEAALNSRPPGPFVEIRKNIYHTWRGAQWTWGNRRFVSVGGAYSVDRNQRVKYVSWWPTEQMSTGDFNYIYDSLEHVEADVLFTHDILNSVDMGIGHDWKSDFPPAHGNREHLQMIADRITPKLIVHGHMHHNYRSQIDVSGRTCLVQGLAANFSDIRKASVILDLTSNPEGMVLEPVEHRAG